jgi:hypothetical protein
MGRKISDKKMTGKSLFWQENDQKSHFTSEMHQSPKCTMLQNGFVSHTKYYNCCMYSSDGVPKVLLKKLTSTSGCIPTHVEGST